MVIAVMPVHEAHSRRELPLSHHATLRAQVLCVANLGVRAYDTLATVENHACDLTGLHFHEQPLETGLPGSFLRQCMIPDGYHDGIPWVRRGESAGESANEVAPTVPGQR